MMDEHAAADDGSHGNAQQATPPQPATGEDAGMAGSPASPTQATTGVVPSAPTLPKPIDPVSPAAPLEALARVLPPQSIDELWIFPPRRIGPGQSTVVVASVMEAPAPNQEAPVERRRIFTARFTLVRGTRVPELHQEMTEEGSAPAQLVARVVDGVVRRLDDEPEPPRYARIDGRAEAWAALLASILQAER